MTLTSEGVGNRCAAPNIWKRVVTERQAPSQPKSNRHGSQRSSKALSAVPGGSGASVARADWKSLMARHGRAALAGKISQAFFSPAGSAMTGRNAAHAQTILISAKDRAAAGSYPHTCGKPIFAGSGASILSMSANAAEPRDDRRDAEAGQQPLALAA